jgi:intracellular multiplication protein IcmD
MSKMSKKILLLLGGSLFCFCLGTMALAVTSGIGGVASQVKSNLGPIAQLLTAGSYILGMGMGVAAIIKFKAHKDNPTQVQIGQPIALLFIAAALLFIPSVFKTSGGTLFGASGTVAGISGVTKFGATQQSS